MDNLELIWLSPDNIIDYNIDIKQCSNLWGLVDDDITFANVCDVIAGQKVRNSKCDWFGVCEDGVAKGAVVIESMVIDNKIHLSPHFDIFRGFIRDGIRLFEETIRLLLDFYNIKKFYFQHDYINMKAVRLIRLSNTHKYFIEI